MSSHGRYPLSAFSAELLARARQKLGGAAFGRLAQELLVCALRDLHPGLHDNRGAGTPDATANEGGVHWTWEFKSTEGEEVTLDETCARGLATAGGSDPRPRLVVLDVAFPAGLWVLEGAGLAAGPFRPDAHPKRQRADEAEALAERLEALLRRCDVELLEHDEAGAKALVRALRA